MDLLQAVRLARKRLREQPWSNHAAPLPGAPPPPAAPGAAAGLVPRAEFIPPAMADELWGEGFVLPGGPTEIARLAAPLGCNASNTLLLLGAGIGGAAHVLAEGFGTFVNAYEADPLALHEGRARRPKALARQVTLQRWNTGEPSFRAGAHATCLALEPLRHAAPGPLLVRLAAAMRPNAQIVLLDLVAGPAAEPHQLEAWSRVEHRRLPPPAESEVTDGLRAQGFDVPVVEDISRHHTRLAIAGWRALLRRLEENRPDNAFAAALVEEAERWLLRLRLLRQDQLRLIRWHALRSRRAEG